MTWGDLVYPHVSGGPWLGGGDHRVSICLSLSNVCRWAGGTRACKVVDGGTGSTVLVLRALLFFLSW